MLSLEDKINIYRFKKLNVYNSVLVHTKEEIKNLIHDYIGIHAARIGKPFISLLNKGVEGNLQEIYQSINFDPAYITIRCMRRTLHIVHIDQVQDVHCATRSICLSGLKNKFSDMLINKSQNTLTEMLLDKNAAAPSELYAVLIEKYSLSRDEATALIKYHWENGLLCLLNHSEDVFHEKRMFGLTSSVYNIYLTDHKDVEDAISRLTMMYIQKFGPVSLGDIFWWTGLPRGKIGEALLKNKSEIEKITLPYTGIELYLSRNELESINSIEMGEHWCKFMGFEDSALKAYKETRFLYANRPEQYFNPIGEIYPTILLNGKCVGTWAIDVKKTDITVNMEDFDELVFAEKQRMIEKLFGC